MNNDVKQSLKDAVFTIFDTETTGDNVKRADRPIEFAAVHWNYQQGFLGKPKSWLINPQMPIHPAAIAVHGLTDEDVQNAPLLEDILPEIHEYIANNILVAHNIEFDLNMVPSFRKISNFKIDSLRLVRHIFKIGELGHKEQQLTSHKMQELRYWLNLRVNTMGLQAHRAAADILVTGEVFSETLKRFIDRSFNDELTVEDLIKFSSSPILIEKMSFGKYKDVKIYDAIKQEMNKPKNYFKWLYSSVHNGDIQIDEDLKYSIEYFLKQHNIEPSGLLLNEKQKNWKDLANTIEHSSNNDKNMDISNLITLLSKPKSKNK